MNPILFIFVSGWLHGVASIQFPSFIGSSMVFQRGLDFEIWGTDSAGSDITAFFLSKPYTTKADNTGYFSLTFPAQPATITPIDIDFTSSFLGPKVTLTDIVFGDVFISSGQSNMELPLSWNFNYSDILADASQYAHLIRVSHMHTH